MYSFDVTAENFQQVVVDGSFKTPVVVDFWAPWCGPCKTLKPILEKLAQEYAGKFVLAKINSDENQEIAAQFGVRGIPSVKAIREGQLVDEFSGALPEPQVREWLNRLSPSPAEELRHQAHQTYQQGDADTALALLDQALTLDNENNDAIIDKANILAKQKKLAEAKALLESLPANIQIDDNVAKIIAQIEVAEKSQNLEGEDVLLAKVQQNPDDLATRLDLANLYVSQQRYEDAFEQCFEIIQRDRSFEDDIGRKTALNIFSLLGNEGDLVRNYRRKLSSLLN